MLRYFPLNYIWAASSLVRPFRLRRSIKFWYMPMIILFLHGLIMVPLSIQQAKQTTDDLIHYTPQAMALLTDELAQWLSDMPYSSNQLIIDQPHVITLSDSSVTGSALNRQSAQTALQGRTGILFTPEEFIIAEDGTTVFYQTYNHLDTLAELATADELRLWLSEQWYQSNRPAIILSNAIYIHWLMLVSLLLLIFGSSFFLNFMKRSDVYDFKTYKEVLALILNCLFIPTIIAMVLGLMGVSATSLITVQAIGFVLMIMGVYYFTHFQDIREEQRYG